MQKDTGQHSTLGEAMRADVKAAHARGLNLIATVAEEIGKSQEIVYKWTEEVRTANVFDFLAWCRLAESNHAADWLVRALGYEPVRRREGEYTARDVEIHSLPSVISEFGDVIGKVAESLADGKIDAAERRQIHRAILEAGTALEQLRYDVEAAMPPADGRVTSLADTQRKAREA